MEKAKVYFTDFRTKANGDGLPTKLKKLIRKAGIADLDLEGKFVAIKMHFGEMGNISYLRPNYARAVVDVVKELGGKPFLTDCNTLYPGSRKNALEHLYCAWENGFTPLTVGCPILIGDGLKGTDDVEVPVEGGEYVEKAKIGRAVMDADVFISLNHFKGHEMTGFGGAIKNLGMGCGSRAGKMEMHSAGKPRVSERKCIGFGACARICAHSAITITDKNGTTTADIAKGAKGDKGDTGAQGPQGEKGLDGTITFEELTPEQKETLRGDAGPQGPRGDSGVYVGETAPENDQVLVWINPNGEVSQTVIT